MNVHVFANEKRSQRILAVAGALLALVAMILAILTTANDGNISIPVIAVTALAAVLAVVTGVVDFNDLGKILVAGMYILCMGLFLSSQLGNLGYALAGIHDIGNGIQPGFLVGEVLYLAALVLESITIFKK